MPDVPDEPVKVRLKVNVHDLLQEAVEQGLAYTARRAFKHRDEPYDDRDLEAFLITQGVDYVMNAIYEFIDPAGSEVIPDDPD